MRSKFNSQPSKAALIALLCQGGSASGCLFGNGLPSRPINLSISKVSFRKIP